jgi:hypothetical protein
MTVAGTVSGTTIQLEEPVPGLEGRRVRVQLEVIDEPEPGMSPDESAQAWEAWVASGPQGPLDDDDGPAWP